MATVSNSRIELGTGKDSVNVVGAVSTTTILGSTDVASTIDLDSTLTSASSIVGAGGADTIIVGGVSTRPPLLLVQVMTHSALLE